MRKVKTDLSLQQLIAKMESHNSQAYDSWLLGTLFSLKSSIRELIAANDLIIHFLKTQALIRASSHIPKSNRGEQK